MASLSMQNGINHSLAALRGWIILGKVQFKEDRAEAWNEEISTSLADMDANAERKALLGMMAEKRSDFL